MNTPTGKHQLDYSPLTSPVTRADIADFKRKYPRHWSIEKAILIIVVVLIALFFVPFMGVMVASAFSPSAVANLLIGGVTICATVGLIIAGFFLLRRHDERLVRLDRFATVNNITFLVSRPDPAYSGMIFDEGHSRKINEGFRFRDGVEIGNYEYTTGSGKNQQQHTFGYVSVPIDRRLPHMVLDAKRNNFFGISNLPDTFDSSQTLKLEGDFNEHFNLFAPKAYERDALYVFTPDVMVSLIDNGKYHDMEVVDNKLYVYSSTAFNLTSPEQLETLLKMVAHIGVEIRKQSSNYADERVNDRSVDIIAPSGRRLKKGVNIFVVVIFVGFIILQFSDVLWPLFGQYTWLAIIIAFFGLGLFALIYSLVNSARRR